MIIGLPDICPQEPPIVPVNYVNAVERVGHTVRVLPYSMDRQTCNKLLDELDAILFMGGGDIEAKWFGCKQSPLAGVPNQHRDEFELLLFELALERRLPVMGICRGHQLINIGLGGDLYQDLPSEYPSVTERLTSQDTYTTELINHSRPDSEWAGVHDIEIVPESRLYKILQHTTVHVNSTHHQAIRRLGRTLHVSARSADGVIEAIESDYYPIASVQFHPERLAFGNDTLFTPLFAKILEYCSIDLLISDNERNI